ncbi:hypothetical protein [Micromonospora sp. WMMD812]|uniref:hypothetical protein n=1 Tax=Micromonospora sp. WMMD812 TaxID=3015152 RepID=UPI00248CFFEA|nr:hypothetical protein [Micromonospora sp. WMMD812]WBB69141.1 hypothetical protein O7603_07270 [Micromonospora sp. WMMD812]
MEVSSPIDGPRLRAEVDTATKGQFQAPLSDADYRTLAAILAEHPSVTLRVYGFDTELSTLRFLRWFPHLRRLSVADLFHLTDLTPLRQLGADVEFLDLGETRKPLDLTRPPRSGTCGNSGSQHITVASRTYSTPTPTCRASPFGESRSTGSSRSSHCRTCSRCHSPSAP